MRCACALDPIVLVPILHGSAQVAAVRLMHNVLGGTIDPHAAWMVLRGLKTLNLRVKQQNTSAMLLARRLEAHSKIAAVHYPGKSAVMGDGRITCFETAVPHVRGEHCAA